MKNDILARVRRRAGMLVRGLSRRPGRRPRVGITGSFGHGNYGDELFVKTHQHYLGGVAELHLLTGLPHADYLYEFGKSRVDLMDTIVIGGGDLICPYRERIDQDFASRLYLRRPVHMVGIGVEDNKPEVNSETLRKWTSFLRHRNLKTLTMRDARSKLWIDENIRPDIPVTVSPDIVMALPLAKAGKTRAEPILGLVTRSIKSPKEYVQMTAIAQYLLGQGWHVRHVIAGVGRHGQAEYENSKHVDIPGKETFHVQDLDEITRALGECSLVLSMKLHTTIVATMQGVPCVTLNPSGKIHEFMKLIGREELYFEQNDTRAFDLVRQGVPPVPMDRVDELKRQAKQRMIRLRDDIRRDRGAVPGGDQHAGSDDDEAVL